MLEKVFNFCLFMGFVKNVSQIFTLLSFISEILKNILIFSKRTIYLKDFHSLADPAYGSVNSALTNIQEYIFKIYRMNDRLNSLKT